MIRRLVSAAAIGSLAALAACGGFDADAPGSAASASNAPPGSVVDSALPMPELLRRLQARAGARPESLSGGARSRDGLIRRFVQDLARSDTASLAGATLTLAEFAWLYYPDHPYSAPPYDMPPEIAWIQYQANGTQGWRRLRAEMMGRPLRLLGHECREPAARWGENRQWTNCVVRLLRDGQDTVRAELFGSIVERSGRFKFVTYANKL